MDQCVSFSEPKVHLAVLVQAAEAGEAVRLSRHGRPVAVLLPEPAHQALQRQQVGMSQGAAIAPWRAAARPQQAKDWPVFGGGAGLREIEVWRNRTSGREVWLG